MGLFKKWKDRIEQQKLNKIAALFLNGKVDNAKPLLQIFEYKKSGDVAAIKVLMAKTDAIDSLRETYHGLWEAKLKRFVNNDVAEAVDAALDAVTPLVMARAEDDIRKLHKHFTDGDKSALFSACKEHVAYGHPDAIALQIAGYLQFGFESDDPSETYRYDYHAHMLYSNWFYDLSRAKRKGFSNDIKPLAEQALHQLELLGGDGIITDPVPNWPDDPIDHPLWWE